jgi:hypothetical protein
MIHFLPFKSNFADQLFRVCEKRLFHQPSILQYANNWVLSEHQRIHPAEITAKDNTPEPLAVQSSPNSEAD